MKVTVIQPGSRHRYFIPQLFQERGVLELFATDFTTRSSISRLLKKTGLIKRPDIVNIPADKIVSADTAVLLHDLFSRLLGKRSSIQYHTKVNQLIASQLRQRGIGDTSIIYCMNIDYADYLEYVKAERDHVRIICDIYAHPMTPHIINAASAEFPNWPYRRVCDEDIVLRENRFIQTAAVADILLCPSEWVAQGVRDFVPKHADKIRVCAYGSSIDYHGKRNTSIRGRFLWAGRKAIGKGLPYLASAANKLKTRYPDMDFRVAGITDKHIIELPECRNLHFLGQLNRTQMQEEFLSADAFVLPTLSEGLAGVLVEAIACGCPAVTTRCAGLDIVHRQNGVLVPDHNGMALADALEELYRDRSYRQRIATEAESLAKEYSTESWTQRLILCLQQASCQSEIIR